MTSPKPPKRFTATHQQMARQMGKTLNMASAYGSGGPGTPVSIMTTNLKRIVIRYKQVKPFPIAAGEFFESVYPIEMFLAHTANDTRWVNLAKALNTEPVVHFHVQGRDFTHETFWVKCPRPMPAPNDISETLYFDSTNAHFDTVDKWITEAIKIHETIEDVMEHLRGFINSVKHPSHVYTHWPELVPFIGQMPTGVGKHVDKVNRRDLSIPGPSRRDEITDLLATCSLLSDTDLAAWVKFPEGVS